MLAWVHNAELGLKLVQLIADLHDTTVEPKSFGTRRIVEDNTMSKARRYNAVAENLWHDGNSRFCNFFHVVGSASANPANDDNALRSQCEALLGKHYRQIILGFIIEHNRSRWLNHQEIATGVIHAMNAPKPISIVGTVEPWSLRP